MSAVGEEPWIWWKHGVIYHIYPRSFQDSNDDGIGDLQGIIGRLDYLRWLGVDALWLSPVYRSPMVDFGYDVASYRDIDPMFGTMDDFLELLSKAHARGIRVILDMIPNHTSNLHPWFKESSSSISHPRRDWYIWKDPVDGGPPNNWKSAVGGSAWTFDPQTGQYFLHTFFKEQPDLNWRNSNMAGAFFDEMKFWLDLGVDGFRLDVINMIAKDKKFRDNPVFMGMPALQQHRYTRNRKRSVTVVTRMRKLLDGYDDRVVIGEIYTPPPGSSRTAARYLGKEGEGIHLAFDFSLIFTRWSARAYYRCISAWYASIPDEGWPCHVLSNHDLFRSIDRWPWRRHKEEKAKVAAALLLTLKGTPFIYYGEEIGMRNGRLAYHEIRDPLGRKYWPFFTGRDKARTPMQWNDGAYSGFSRATPWLPVNPDYRRRNVKDSSNDNASLLTFYQRLISLRKSERPLSHGTWAPIVKGDKGILAFYRIYGEEKILVVLNFTSSRKKISLENVTGSDILLSTHCENKLKGCSQLFEINPFEATIYKVRTGSGDFRSGSETDH